MSDDFLGRFREEPDVEFAEALSRRIHGLGKDAPSRPKRRLAPVAVWAVSLGGAILVLLLPAGRAAARSFLDLFRVKHFAAVPVDPGRLARLRQGGLDLKSLVSEQVEVVEPARAPETVDSPDAAADAAGMVVRRPSVLPKGADLLSVSVGHPGSFRLSLDTAKLEVLAHALGVEDADIPAEWNGATVDVQAPPVVALRYQRGGDEFVLLQSKSPEVTLPAGIDLPRLGTLGLRMAGMSAEEAEIFAKSIDWRSTLLVPIPAAGGTFREVEVHGRKGLLVTALSEAKGSSRWHSVLLWAEGNVVFAAQGPGQGVEVLELAQSVG